MERLSRSRRKDLRRLRTKKGRRSTGRFLVEGVRACEALVDGGALVETVLLATDVDTEGRAGQVAAALARKGAEALQCTREDAQFLADATTTQGLIAVAGWRDRPLEELLTAPPPFLLALDRVSDPGNVGTILRAGDWFGVDGVVLGQGCAELIGPKTVRASVGSIFHVPVWRDADLADLLPRLSRAGHAILAAGAEGKPCRSGWLRKPTTIVLSNEAHGLSTEIEGLADEVVAVPGRGHAESLNVAMATVALLALARPE